MKNEKRKNKNLYQVIYFTILWGGIFAVVKCGFYGAIKLVLYSIFKSYIVINRYFIVFLVDHELFKIDFKEIERSVCE